MNGRSMTILSALLLATAAPALAANGGGGPPPWAEERRAERGPPPWAEERGAERGPPPWAGERRGYDDYGGRWSEERRDDADYGDWRVGEPGEQVVRDVLEGVLGGTGAYRGGTVIDGDRPEQATGIPPGHMPPPGECRVWQPGVPPGQQPPPYRC